MESIQTPETPRPHHGDAEWKPSRLQRERARAIPPPSDERAQVGGHSFLPSVLQEFGLVKGFSHLVLEVTDLERAVAWYTDIAGLDTVGYDLTNEDRHHAALQLNTGQMLILVQSDRVERGTGGLHHAFMMTPNQYRRMMERVLAAGYDLVDIRAQFRAHGEYSINIVDPDGHRIQFQCNSPEARAIIKPDAGVVDCGPATAYRVGDVKLFKEGDFFLVRRPEGFLAMTRWCTHLNGRIIYQREHWRFYCPYHQSTFDRCGNPIGGEPNLTALRLNAISFSPEGHVLVDTDEVIQRDLFDPSQAATWGSGVGGQEPAGASPSATAPSPTPGS
ncbi:MAG: Rieske (2Fe-2S) iron-sulfur domain [Chloroflexi bacterium]|nr:Rieske (2Fe-2S) iron-sulfur domain [Chloroflexota bacterium]